MPLPYPLLESHRPLRHRRAGADHAERRRATHRLPLPGERTGRRADRQNPWRCPNEPVAGRGRRARRDRVARRGRRERQKEFVGRSPGQLALARLRRDRTALISGGLLAFFVLVALAVPLIEALYGVGPKGSSRAASTATACRWATPAA
ncbi:hypothetical protein V2I01_07920 [Micromonospora sp. BRA006-A]|nr:hypothetical protein [Micromonospora sp. BRA006-A]